MTGEIMKRTAKFGKL